MSNQVHKEFLVDKWETLLSSAQKDLPAVLGTVVEKGGSRPAWQQVIDNEETILVTYPAENYVRAGVILQGEAEGKLDVKSVLPLAEGILNHNLVVQDIYPWKSGVEGEVCILNPAIGKAFWAYNPLFFRDKSELQINAPLSFLLSGIALDIRPAYLDELTVTQGPAYEEHSMNFLAANPDKSRLDVPPLKISIVGQQIIGLGKHVGEYQARIRIANLNEFEFGNDEGKKMQMYSFMLNLATPEEPMHVVLYVSKKAFAKEFELKEGMDVDIYFWLQARIVD